MSASLDASGADNSANPTEEGTLADGFHRVHRATPAIRGGISALALVAVLLGQGSASALGDIATWVRHGHFAALALVPLAIGLLAALVYGASWFWWKAAGYRITEEEVQFRRGLLRRSLRTARMDRIQAVDVVQPFLALIFGLTALRIETAGGQDSAIQIEYLSRSDAERLQEQILRHAALDEGSQGSAQPPAVDGNAPTASVPSGSPTGQGAEETVLLPALSLRRMLGSVLISPVLFGCLLSCVGLVLSMRDVWGFLLGAFTLGSGFVSQLNQVWQFRTAQRGGTLRVSYGLTERRKQTIQLNRVHGITAWQPFLWRPLGWWKVSCSVAGYGLPGDNEGTTTVLPVGGLDEAVATAAALGTLTEDEVRSAAHPRGAGEASWLHSPLSARWVSPLDHRQQAVTLVRDVLITHSGRLRPRVSFIATPHIQELTAKQGPVQRTLGLATVRCDLVPGPVDVVGRDLAYEDGQRLLTRLRQRRLPSVGSRPA